MAQELKEGDAVLCTVTKIERTTVFLDVEDNGPGTMVLSEVAAGRIRNLRAHVAPHKKIVCKILKVESDHIELSLRRVTGKEREIVLERHKKERNLLSMFKAITPKKAESTLEKIKDEYDILDFVDDAREDPKILEKFFTKEEAKKIHTIFAERMAKEKTVDKTIILTSDSSTGVEDIKSILKTDEAKISYLGSSKFSVAASAPDFRQANYLLEQIIEKIQEKAKEKHAIIQVKETKK